MISINAKISKGTFNTLSLRGMLGRRATVLDTMEKIKNIWETQLGNKTKVLQGKRKSRERERPICLELAVC